jgi:hypothetical protein
LWQRDQSWCRASEGKRIEADDRFLAFAHKADVLILDLDVGQQ